MPKATAREEMSRGNTASKNKNAQKYPAYCHAITSPTCRTGASPSKYDARSTITHMLACVRKNAKWLAV